MSEPRRTTFERAFANYDQAFERTLTDDIMQTIATASIVSDQNVVAIRTGETTAALITCLGTVLALCPDHDVPSRLRQRVDEIAKRLQRDVARARAEGIADIVAAGKQGHA
jgi:hypothetical protein